AKNSKTVPPPDPWLSGGLAARCHPREHGLDAHKRVGERGGGILPAFALSAAAVCAAQRGAFVKAGPALREAQQRVPRRPMRDDYFGRTHNPAPTRTSSFVIWWVHRQSACSCTPKICSDSPASRPVIDDSRTPSGPSRNGISVIAGPACASARRP